jgi:acetyltransferase-like isoleucine patch superfamily enzyme
MANVFHPTVKVGPYTSIEVSTRGTDTIIGQNSVIDDFVKIKHVGGKGNIEIGEYVFINSGTVIYSGNGIKIGNNVLIGPNCNIVPANHEFRDKNILIRLQGFQPTKGGVVIEDDVWLGANVTILDGAIIRKGCVIAANSLVKGETEEFGIYAGSPALKIKSR